MLITVSDDYQQVARNYADWSVLPHGSEVQFFSDHESDEDKLVERLTPFEVIVAMRERTPFPRSLLARLPAPRLLVTTGLRSAARHHAVALMTDAGSTNSSAQLIYPL